MILNQSTFSPLHRTTKKTYSVLRNAIDARVGDVGQGAFFSQVVFDRVHAQVADLVEGPARDSLGELLVPNLDGFFVTRALNLSIQPLVLKHLGGANNSETSRVARLEGGHQVQLRARGEHLVDHLGLLLWVVNVCSPGGLQDGCQLRAVAESKAQTMREREKVSFAATSEVVLGAGLVLGRSWQEENIVLLSGGLGIVVEMVDHETRSLGRDLDVELEEDGVEGGRHRCGCTQGKKDVSASVDEVEDLLRC